MAPQKKYLDFTEGAPVTRLAKKLASSAEDERQYIPLTCPHCKTVFVEIPSDRVASNKASACRDHLAKCISDAAKVDERRPSDTNTAAAVREQTAVMQAQHAESMAVQTEQLASQRRSEEHLRAMREAQRLAICSVLGLSDHSSDDEDGSKVAARAKRKVETLQAAATLDAFDCVAKAGRFSPPRDDEPPVAVGKRMVECVTAVAADAGQVAGLRSQLAAVNAEVGIDEGAPPAVRMSAIHALKTTAATGDERVAKKRQDAVDHFQNVARAAGRDHKTLHEQVEHVEALAKAAAVAQANVHASTAKQGESKHLKRIDTILGLGGRTTQAVREDEIAILKHKDGELARYKRSVAAKEAEQTNELKKKFAADSRLVRHMTASKNLLKDGHLYDKLVECIPTSGNKPDDTIPKSGTRHA